MVLYSRMFFPVRSMALMTSALSAVLFTVPAYSQTTNPEVAEEASSGVEEIVVTARKREENLQETPISISAFTTKGIEDRQIQQVLGIAQFTPALTFENAAPISGNSSVAVVFIRGIGQVESIPTVDLGVGLYVDGVYLARSVGGILDLLDPERIEVLRGPQGTLFGRNTIGGAINITTKKPEAGFSGDVSILYGTDNYFIPKASLNLPLSENMFLRVSGAYTNQDGYVKKANGQDTGDKNRLSGRAQLRILASDVLEFNFAVDGTRERTNGAAFVLSDTNASGFYPANPDGSPTPFPDDQKAGLFPFFHNIVFNGATCAGGPPPVVTPPANPQCFGDHYISARLNSDASTKNVFSNLDIFGLSSTIDFDLGPVQLKSITAYRDTKSAYNIDQDHTPLLIAEVDSVMNQWQFTQELQLLGQAFDDRLNYIVGAYYFKEKAETVEEVRFPVVSLRSGGLTNNESLAIFGQATFRATDKLSLTGGLRYTRDDKTFLPVTFVNSSVIGLPPGFPLVAEIGPSGPQPAAADTLRFKKWTPMVNATYQWSDDFMTYVTYSQGYKSGGFTQRVFPPVILAPGQTVGDAIGFQPENAKVIEGGFKSDLLDRMLRINGSMYRTNYTGVQVTVQNTSVAPIILNAARARIWGGELEITAVPTDGLTLEANLGYINAKFLEVGANSQVLVTDKLLKTPKWTVSAGIAYEIQTGSDWTVTPRVDFSYRARTENNAINSPQVSQPGYSLLDAGLLIENESNGWSLLGRARNLTNKKYITGAFSDDINLGLTEVVRDRGREFTVTLRKKF